MDAPIQNVLAVINEVDLFRTWMPMVKVRLVFYIVCSLCVLCVYDACDRL